jgi:hypothetical protein
MSDEDQKFIDAQGIDEPECVAVPPVPDPLRVRFPGGLVVEAMPLGEVITDLSLVQSMSAQLAPAMAGVYPVFVLVDTVIALKDTVTSIPGLLVGDVDTFTGALERVTRGVATLLSMTPQVAVPALVSDVLGVVAANLRAMADLLRQVDAMQAEAQAIIDEATSQVPPDVALQQVGECLEDQASASLEHALAGLEPVNKLMDLLTNLLALVPGMPSLPVIPSADELTQGSISEAIDILEGIADVLDALQIPGA